MVNGIGTLRTVLRSRFLGNQENIDKNIPLTNEKAFLIKEIEEETVED